jgi:FMN phosphatase YigB (HAD superfamily)
MKMRPGAWPAQARRLAAKNQQDSFMPLTLEQYASYLDSRRELSWPAPPPTEPPKAKPHLAPMPEIKAVCWNIYGTLLALSEGELLFEHPQKFVMELALDKTLQEFKMWGSMSRKPGQPAEYLSQLYRKGLDEQRLAPSRREKHPELSAERIWEGIVKKLLQKDYRFDAGFFGSLNEYSKKIAYFFHASLQGTACYPGAAAALAHVKSRGLRQGILADGQCFTLLQLQRGLAQEDGSVAFHTLFDPELLVLSGEQGGRKPSERLFRRFLETLEPAGIRPEEVLHIGSRMALDVIPARKLGMCTGLFAGDKASLQATAEQLKDPAGRPDVLLTELCQITKVI